MVQGLMLIISIKAIHHEIFEEQIMEREIKGITIFSFVWELFIFGGFIFANEANVQRLIQAYEWLFYFYSGLGVVAIFAKLPKAKYQFTKAKYHWEITTTLLLGIMLAYYGYFICATILTLSGYTISNYYFNHGEQDETHSIGH